MDFFDADVLIGRRLDQDEEDAPTAGDVLAEMDRSGVARSLVTHQKIAISNADWGNDDIQKAVAGQPRLRGVYGTWGIQDRDTPPMDEAVDRLIKIGAAGVQHWPALCTLEFASWQSPDLFAALAERKLPLFMHADQAGFPQVYEVLRAFPKLLLVFQRVGYTDNRRMLGLMKACSGLHLCTSPPFVGGSALEQFDRFVGCDRLLFGSGLFKYDVTPAAAHVAYSELSDAKKAMIAGGNLDRLLGNIR